MPHPHVPCPMPHARGLVCMLPGRLCWAASDRCRRSTGAPGRQPVTKCDCVGVTVSTCGSQVQSQCSLWKRCGDGSKSMSWHVFLCESHFIEEYAIQGTFGVWQSAGALDVAIACVGA